MTREVRDLDRDVARILEPFSSGASESASGSAMASFDPSTDPSTACTLLVNHLAMRRDKRCLLAYHRTRTDKLEALVWSGVDLLDLEQQQQRQQNGPDGGSGEQAGAAPGAANKSSLSPQEEDYVRQYSDLLAALKGQWTDIDLTGSLEPPRDLFIDVRVLKDAGEIQTEYGCVTPPSLPQGSVMPEG